MDNLDNLEKLKIISKKADLIQELMGKMAAEVSEIANREDMLALSVDDQISVIASAFVSLMSHYKLNTAEVVNVTSQEDITRAQEVTKLEEQLKSIDPNTIDRYNRESKIWETVERKVIKAGDIVRAVGNEGSEEQAAKDAIPYQDG
jgi:hypothetical protein